MAYVSIPLQLVFVATRKVTAIDFRTSRNVTASESFVFDMGVHSHGITPKSMVYELYMKFISWKILVQNR